LLLVIRAICEPECCPAMPRHVLTMKALIGRYPSGILPMRGALADPMVWLLRWRSRGCMGRTGRLRWRPMRGLPDTVAYAEPATTASDAAYH